MLASPMSQIVSSQVALAAGSVTERRRLEPGIYNAMARKHASYPAVHIYDVEILDDTSIDFELTGGNCVPPVRLFHQKQSQINK